ncbi:MAG: alkaline phosphatase family protein [Myxococcales bacterium]|nr:alkaline phosphatase family protein [Myxococcales bacterium]MDH3483959.1 alkaline phosphatase family protein [Myxococcales bacterium]
MTRIRFVATLLLTLSLACSGDGPPPTKHALVIGVDGVRVDALREASTPNIDALSAEGAVSYDAFAGGELGTSNEQVTFSGPGWSSILAGVWIDKHGVAGNTSSAFDDSRFDEYPHFFRRIREQMPDAYLSSFVTWGPINEHIVAPGDADEEFSPEANDSFEGDAMVTDAVVDHLSAQTPDVVFIHLDNPDFQGHLHGFSPMVPEYVQAVETVDAQIGQVLDAVRARPTYAREDWLVVVTTDHGGIEQMHGGQSAEERTIPFIVSGGATQRGATISPGPGHTAVPPTVLRHLGIAINASWGWESEPFGF